MFELTPLSIGIMIIVFALVMATFAYFIRKELK